MTLLPNATFLIVSPMDADARPWEVEMTTRNRTQQPIGAVETKTTDALDALSPRVQGGSTALVLFLAMVAVLILLGYGVWWLYLFVQSLK